MVWLASRTLAAASSKCGRQTCRENPLISSHGVSNIWELCGISQLDQLVQ